MVAGAASKSSCSPSMTIPASMWRDASSGRTTWSHFCHSARLKYTGCQKLSTLSVELFGPSSPTTQRSEKRVPARPARAWRGHLVARLPRPKVRSNAALALPETLVTLLATQSQSWEHARSPPDGNQPPEPHPPTQHRRIPRRLGKCPAQNRGISPTTSFEPAGSPPFPPRKAPGQQRPHHRFEGQNYEIATTAASGAIIHHPNRKFWVIEHRQKMYGPVYRCFQLVKSPLLNGENPLLNRRRTLLV